MCCFWFIVALYQIRFKLEEGEYDAAKKVELELELLMKVEGYEFKKSFE